MIAPVRASFLLGHLLAPLLVPLASLALAAAAGCGPIRYVSGVTGDASEAVDEARAAKAEALAPYWFTRAVEYLQRARYEAAEADWQAANRFGRLALAAAETALTEAATAAADPERAPLAPPAADPEIAPAKEAAPSAPAQPAKDDAPSAPAKETP
jgi:Domain of unknown function (DUF4398)